MHAQLERERHPLLAAEVALVSAIVHAALALGALVATADSGEPTEEPPDAPAFFLIAIDRTLPPPQVHDVAWVEPAGGAAGDAVPRDEGEGRAAAAAAGARGGARAAELVATPPTDFAWLDSVVSVLQVDSAAVRYEGSAAPSYPLDLLEQGLEGLVDAQFVVDTSGAVEPRSVEIIQGTHPGFIASVREALRLMRFRPAVMGSRKVRQLVQQRFRFEITRPLPDPETATPR